jgi:hypothetical protein
MLEKWNGTSGILRSQGRFHREVGLANAEIDRLGSHEDQGLPVFAECLQGVQQDRTGHSIELMAGPWRSCGSV